MVACCSFPSVTLPLPAPPSSLPRLSGSISFTDGPCFFGPGGPPDGPPGWDPGGPADGGGTPASDVIALW